MQGLKFLLGNFVRNDISAPGPEAFVKYCMFFAVRLQDQWSMMNPSSIQPAVSFIWLVRWYTYPSENMSSSVGMSIPNWMESHKIHVPNHQPVLVETHGYSKKMALPQPTSGPYIPPIGSCCMAIGCLQAQAVPWWHRTFTKPWPSLEVNVPFTHDLPSGNLTVCYWKLLFIVDLPIKNGDFP